MSAEPHITERHEIMEERANRDAFHALLIVSGLFALFLLALIIAAWNTRIAFFPLTPKPALHENSFTPLQQQPDERRILRIVEGGPRPAVGVIHSFRPRASGAGFVVTEQDRLTTISAAPLGVAASRTSFLEINPLQDAAAAGLSAIRDSREHGSNAFPNA